MKFAKTVLLVCTGVALSACGGGAGDAAGPEARRQPVSAATVSDELAVTPGEVARRSMDFAELSYPWLFPEHARTSADGIFAYRYYPGTQTYLGVALRTEGAYIEGGIYVMGAGVESATPVFAGMGSDYVEIRTQGQTIDLPANDIVSDVNRGVYYASVAASDASRGYRIAIIDGASGDISLSGPVGDIRALALAADGRSLYAALWEGGELLRLSLPGMQVLSRVKLPDAKRATALAASPVEPHVVAAVVDGSVMLIRDMQVQPMTVGAGSKLVFSEDGLHLYSTSTGLPVMLTLLDVHVDGVRFVKSVQVGQMAYMKSLGVAGSRVVTHNIVWNADLTLYGALDNDVECLPRSSTRLICIDGGRLDTAPGAAYAYDVESLSRTLGGADLNAGQTDRTSIPLLGPDGGLAFRTPGINAQTPSRVVLFRSKGLR